MAFYRQNPYERGGGERGPREPGGGDGRGTPGGGCVEGSPCAGDADCKGGKCFGRVVDPATKRITPGKCSCTGTPPTDTGCPEGSGRAYEGCPCGEAYGTKTGNCVAGYRYVQREPWTGNEDGVVYSTGMVGTCHCEKAISDWKANKKQGKGLGEYKWPQEMIDLYNRLTGRAGEILDMPYGYTPEALNTFFGQGFEKVRAQETPARETMLSDLGREGLLGTGAGLKKLTDLSWGAEKNVSDVMRDVFTLNEAQKRQDLESYTKLAQSLFGTGMDYNTILEQINAARRGEGQNALALFMQYIMSIMNSWKS